MTTFVKGSYLMHCCHQGFYW